MAELQIAIGTPTTLFDATSGAHNSTGAFLEGKFTDGNGADNAFDTTESLTADFTASGGSTASVTFRGTVNICGTDYPVFRLVGFDRLIGISLDSVSYPNFASLGPLDTDPLTVDFCFAAGTQIATPSGFTLVEELAIGDLICRADGGTTAVKWLGHQTAQKCFAGLRMQPVRLRAGALGNGLPHTDLTVTADHGMIVDGYVVNASALINGDSIDWVPMADLPDRFTVYHVETEEHDVILANGAASETFIDVAGRAAFDNYAEYLDLYGAERIIPEMTRHRITTQRLLPEAIKARIGVVDEGIEWCAA